MDSLLDPIVSGISSLLSPLTSDLLPAGTAADTSAPSSTTTKSQSTPVVISPTTTTSIPVAATTTATAAAVPQISTGTVITPTTSRTSVRTSVTASSFLSSQDATTFSTSTRVSSSSNTSSSLSTTTTVTSIAYPAAPSASLAPANSSPDQQGSSANKISTAGVVIAIVFGVALVVSLIYLTCRFCAPVRSRIEAWKERRREERSYREVIDGPSVKEKDDHHSLNSGSSASRKSLVEGVSSRALPSSLAQSASVKETHRMSVSARAAEQLNIPHRPTPNLLVLGQNPHIYGSTTAPGQGAKRFSWEMATEGQHSAATREPQTRPSARSTQQKPVAMNTVGRSNVMPQWHGRYSWEIQGGGEDGMIIDRRTPSHQPPQPSRPTGSSNGGSRHDATHSQGKPKPAAAFVRDNSEILRKAGYDVLPSYGSGLSISVLQAEIAAARPKAGAVKQIQVSRGTSPVRKAVTQPISQPAQEVKRKAVPAPINTGRGRSNTLNETFAVRGSDMSTPPQELDSQEVRRKRDSPMPSLGGSSLEISPPIGLAVSHPAPSQPEHGEYGHGSGIGVAR